MFFFMFKNIMDLRGHRCALPDRRRAIGAATLLFNHLRAKGEGPAFFGNTLGNSLIVINYYSNLRNYSFVLNFSILMYNFKIKYFRNF
jgi:hypothetical protein